MVSIDQTTALAQLSERGVLLTSTDVILIAVVAFAADVLAGVVMTVAFFWWTDRARRRQREREREAHLRFAAEYQEYANRGRDLDPEPHECDLSDGAVPAGDPVVAPVVPIRGGRRSEGEAS